MGRRERQAEKKRQRWAQIAIGVVLVLLMVVSIVQFGGNYSSNGSLTFNGHRFTAGKNGFTVKADGQQLQVLNMPLGQDPQGVTFHSAFGTAVRVDADPAALPLLTGAPFLVVTFDPASPFPDVIDLVRLGLSQEYGNVASAVLRNSSQYSGLPVITCANASAQFPVLRLELANTTQEANVTVSDGCVTLAGDPQGLLAARDWLILAKHGVITVG